jgi:shikimate 5-dehydrogenase
MPKNMYFLGVTTAQSSIHRIFPRWTALAGVEDAVLRGIDLAVDAPPAKHRAAVRTILDDPDAAGGLVTTHKVSVFTHARDLFTGFDADAEALSEVNCIVRRPGMLEGLATDTLTAGLALRAILGADPAPPAALILGAGGAAVALAVNLERHFGVHNVILTDISAARIDHVRTLTPARCEVVESAADHDLLLLAMPPGSLIVNATGVGKDRPGSPLTPGARFPVDAIAWDFNYRGNLTFLDRARSQGIRAVDGWNYFLHGWSQVMSRVYGFELTSPLFAAMVEAAAAMRQ